MNDLRGEYFSCAGFSQINNRNCRHRGMYRVDNGYYLCAQHFRQGFFHPGNSVDERMAIRMAAVLEG